MTTFMCEVNWILKEAPILREVPVILLYGRGGYVDVYYFILFLSCLFSRIILYRRSSKFDQCTVKTLMDSTIQKLWYSSIVYNVEFIT
jgi:hypothetical protein